MNMESLRWILFYLLVFSLLFDDILAKRKSKEIIDGKIDRKIHNSTEINNALATESTTQSSLTTSPRRSSPSFSAREKRGAKKSRSLGQLDNKSPIIIRKKPADAQQFQKRQKKQAARVVRDQKNTYHTYENQHVHLVEPAILNKYEEQYGKFEPSSRIEKGKFEEPIAHDSRHYDDFIDAESDHEHSHEHYEKIKVKHHHHHHHHNHVKEVIKKVEVPVEKIVEKVVHVPKPYPVEKVIEKIVKVPVEKVVHVPKPYPVEKIVEKEVPYPVEKIVRVPYPVEKVIEKIVHVPVEKVMEKIIHVPKPVEKIVNKIVHVPFPVIKPVPYPVEVKVPIHVEKKVPVPYKIEVEKKVPVPYKVEVEKKVPVYVQSKEPYEYENPHAQHHYQHQEIKPIKETEFKGHDESSYEHNRQQLDAVEHDLNGYPTNINNNYANQNKFQQFDQTNGNANNYNNAQRNFQYLTQVQQGGRYPVAQALEGNRHNTAPASFPTDSPKATDLQTQSASQPILSIAQPLTMPFHIIQLQPMPFRQNFVPTLARPPIATVSNQFPNQYNK